MSEATVSSIKPSNALPFIPSYLRNTPLDTYNKTAKDPIFLPTRWNADDSSDYIKVMDNGLGLRCIGPGRNNSDAAAIRTDFPIPRKVGFFYYELDILNKGEKGFIGLGIGLEHVDLNKMPGWERYSLGYHGDNGLIYIQHPRGRNYGPLFTEGDTIGCGVNFYNRTVFYTKNGVNLGTAYIGIDHGEFYPMVGLITTDEWVEANFGEKPFMYNISRHAKMVFDHAVENDLHVEQESPGDYELDDLMPPRFYCDNCGAFY